MQGGAIAAWLVFSSCWMVTAHYTASTTLGRAWCRRLDGKHGAGGSTDNGLGDTPEQHMTQTSAPVRPHDNQVDLFVARRLQDFLGRLAHRDFCGRRPRIGKIGTD